MRRTLGSDEPLLRSLEALRQDADFLEARAESAEPVAGDVAEFRALHPALLPRVLRRWISRRLGFDWVPRRRAIARLAGELARDVRTPRRIPLGEGVELVLAGGSMRLAAGVGDYALDWNWRCEPRIAIPGTGVQLVARVLGWRDAVGEGLPRCGRAAACFRAAALPALVQVRNWRPGDRMTPFGHGSQRRIKDVFSAAGIAADLRPLHPLVVADGTTVWVAGVRRSADLLAVEGGEVALFRREFAG
jgi:tRNA(Ile)-lysidine synthase